MMVAGTGLTVGFNKIEITPDVGCELSGFVARQGGAIGVHDPLWARTLVISDGSQKIAIIAADLIGFDQQIIQKIRERVTGEVNIRPESIICSATHTHSGPVSIGRGFLGEINPVYQNKLIERIVQSVTAADRKRKAACIAVGNAVSDIGKNRRHPGGPTDPVVTVVRVATTDQQLILVNYACHPVVLGPDNRLITADYPYYLIKTLEAVYPETEVMFINGATGDVNVGHNASDSIRRAGTSKRTFVEAERLGRLLAGRTMEALETSKRLEVDQIHFHHTELGLPYEKVLTPVEYQKLALEYNAQASELKAISAANIGEIRQLEIWSDWAGKMAKLSETGSIQQQISTEATTFSMGDLEFVTLPGEFFHQFGLALRQRRPDKLLFIMGYAGDAIGYVAPAEVYSEGGYEITDSYRYYGLPSKLAAGSGEMVVDALLKMLEND